MAYIACPPPKKKDGNSSTTTVVKWTVDMLVCLSRELAGNSLVCLGLFPQHGYRQDDGTAEVNINMTSDYYPSSVQALEIALGDE